MKQIIPQHPTTILDYWRLIRRYGRMIAGLAVASVLITGIVSKISPKLYEAKATIIPSRQDLPAGGISLSGDKDKGGGSGGVGSIASLEVLGGKSGPSLAEILQAIMLSRKMAEVVAEQLNLTSYYDVTSLSEAASALRSELEVKAGRFKLIEVTVLTKDPKMAAEIVNVATSNLHHLQKELNISAAKQNREFLEMRLAEKTKKVFIAEEALKTFQTEHRAITVKEQAEKAAITVADLHAQIVALEVELAALREYATPSHPMINQLQAKISEYKRELDRMERDQGLSIATKGKRAPFSQKAFASFEEAPSLTLEFLRLSRQLKVEESIYGMLVGTLEQAKIAETRDLPSFQVLDPAIPPAHRSRPKTLQNVLVAGIVSLVFGALLALFFNNLEVLKTQERLSAHDGNNVEAYAMSDSNGNGAKVEGYPVAPKEVERLHG